MACVSWRLSSRVTCAVATATSSASTSLGVKEHDRDGVRVSAELRWRGAAMSHRRSSGIRLGCVLFPFSGSAGSDTMW